MDFRKKSATLRMKGSLYKEGRIRMNNVQSDFFADLIDKKIAVTVFLVNGVKLQGIITKQDDNSLLLRRDGHTQLVFKHAVSTIMPSVAVNIADEQ